MHKGERPDSGCSHRRCVLLQDAANHSAVSKKVEVVIVPLAGCSVGRCALEDSGAMGFPTMDWICGTARG
jgi:hypothetical protein